MKGGIETREHQICFVGGNYKDFVFYMALLLNNMGNSIIINDLSPKHDFMIMFSEENLDETLFTYKNIDIYFGKYMAGHYDFVLDYFGDIQYTETFDDYRYIIVNSSMGKQEILHHIKGISRIRKESILIIRDIAGGANKKYLKQNYIKYMTYVSFVYEISLDYMDKDYQTEMDYGGFIRFKYLSPKYCKTLIKTAVILTGKPENMVEKALKRAKEGKILDNRILE